MAAPLTNVLSALNRRLFRCYRRCQSASLCSSSTNRAPDRNPLPVFASDDVQQLLRKMTGFNISKITAPKPVPHVKPKYRLLTTEELEEIETKAIKHAKYRLQMPPYMQSREDTSEILATDTELQGLETSKLVFTDITFGVKDRTRLIVIRDPDGTLRKASWEERDRINQIYNPQDGRFFSMPHMFKEQNLEELLKKKSYAYILDRACVQFEPDHPDYLRVTHRTFQHIDDKHDYDHLRSTRHFGPMAFHYAWNKQIDYLLIDMLQRNRTRDAGRLVKLYNKLYPESQSAAHCSDSKDSDDMVIMDNVKIYCEKEARHKGQLELAIQGVEVKDSIVAN